MIKIEKEFAWLALAVWIAPCIYAEHKTFYLVMCMLALILAIITEVRAYLKLKIERLKSELHQK